MPGLVAPAKTLWTPPQRLLALGLPDRAKIPTPIRIRQVIGVTGSTSGSFPVPMLIGSELIVFAGRLAGSVGFQPSSPAVLSWNQLSSDSASSPSTSCWRGVVAVASAGVDVWPNAGASTFAWVAIEVANLGVANGTVENNVGVDHGYGNSTQTIIHKSACFDAVFVGLAGGTGPTPVQSVPFIQCSNVLSVAYAVTNPVLFTVGWNTNGAGGTPHRTHLTMY